MQLVGSTARGRSAGRVKVGALAPRGARRITSTIRVRGRNVYSVRKGRVRAVAVAAPALIRKRAALRGAVALLVRAKASQTRPVYEPNEAEKAGLRVTGQTLAGSPSPKLNSALELLCRLQL